MSEVLVKQHLVNILNCQKIVPVYQGWDLTELRNKTVALRDCGILVSETDGEEAILLAKLYTTLAPFCISRTGSLNMRDLNKYADEARELLGLPSIRELDPDHDRRLTRIEQNKAEGKRTIFDDLAEGIV